MRKKKGKGVSIKRQVRAANINSEIDQVCEYIAEELVKIWELWDLEKSRGYFYDVSSEYTISFMQRGCMGDGPSYADWLFKHRTKWIHECVCLTREDIADPEKFLSKHREYRRECDEHRRKSKEETERKEKEKRRKRFEELKQEFVS